MHSLDRGRLARVILLVLASGALLGPSACGGEATGLDPDDPDYDGSGGTSGRTGGASGGGQATSGSGNGNAGRSGSSTSGAGGSGTAGATGRSGGAGGAGGVAGSGSGTAGRVGTGGIAGSGGSAGSAGVAGNAGSSGTGAASLCVDLSSGLAGLPSRAFPSSDDFARSVCGAAYESNTTYQAICLPWPGMGQSCRDFYPSDLVSLLYECGGQSSASFICGVSAPPAGMPGCVGNECCFVLGGACPP